MSLFSAAILLFFVMDPIGNIPLFLAAIRPVTPERRLRVVVQMAFGKYDSADWKTDCMMQCLFADHDFGAATAYIDNKCDALVRG